MRHIIFTRGVSLAGGGGETIMFSQPDGVKHQLLSNTFVQRLQSGTKHPSLTITHEASIAPTQPPWIPKADSKRSWPNANSKHASSVHITPPPLSSSYQPPTLTQTHRAGTSQLRLALPKGPQLDCVHRVATCYHAHSQHRCVYRRAFAREMANYRKRPVIVSRCGLPPGTVGQAS
jgi:hypothetical protein